MGEKPPPWWEIPLLGGVLLHCTDGKNSKPPREGDLLPSMDGGELRPRLGGYNCPHGLVVAAGAMTIAEWWLLVRGGDIYGLAVLFCIYVFCLLLGFSEYFRKKRCSYFLCSVKTSFSVLQH